MPLHEYYCPKCNEKFEYLHKTIEEGRLDRCPMCGEKVEKLVPFGTSFVLKGYGWPSKENKNPPPPPSSTTKKGLKKKIKKLRDDGFDGPLTPKF